MTVNDLIETLKKYDKDTLVAVNGYEGGVTDKIEVKLIDICPNVYNKWYMGEHEYYNSNAEKDCIKQPRVIISKIYG